MGFGIRPSPASPLSAPRQTPVRYSSTSRPCCRGLSTAVKTRPTKRLPSALCVPKLLRRQSPARRRARSALAGELEQKAEAAKQRGFDLDAVLDADLLELPRSEPTLTFEDLDLVIRHADVLPPGGAVKWLSAGEYSYQAPGMARAVRVTTRPDYFDQHGESLELWSFGSPCFPSTEAADDLGNSIQSLQEILRN